MTPYGDDRDLFRVEGLFQPVTLRRWTRRGADGAPQPAPGSLEAGGFMPRRAGGWRKAWVSVRRRRPGSPAFVQTDRLDFWLNALVRPRGADLSPAEEADARALMQALAAREEDLLRRMEADPATDGGRSLEWVCYPGEADGDLPAGVLDAAADPACHALIVHLYLRSDCLQRCTYCACAGTDPWPPGEADRDVAAVEKVARQVLEPAALRGAEVEVRLDSRDLLAHPRLDDVVRRLNRASPGPVHITAPGNQASDPAFARALSGLPGLDSVTMTLYGATAATHDAVTGRPGSFAEVVRAARNLVALEGVRVQLNWLVTRAGLAEMPGVLDLSARLCDRLDVRFPFSDSVRHREVLRGLYPPLDRVRETLQAHADAVARWASRLVDFPRCAVPESLQGKVAREQPPEALRWYPPIAECEGCAHGATCIRVPEPYLEDHGTAGLRPFPVPGGGALP